MSFPCCQAALRAAERGSGGVGALLSMLCEQVIEHLGDELLLGLGKLGNGIELLSEPRCGSEAGRILFAKSRQLRKSTNDADRLRKYLARFKLNWADIAQ